MAIAEYEGVVPSRALTQDEFNSAVQSFLAWLADLPGDINAVATEISEQADVEVYSSTTYYSKPKGVLASDGKLYRCQGIKIKGDDPVDGSSNWICFDPDAVSYDSIVSNATATISACSAIIKNAHWNLQLSEQIRLGV